MYVMSQDLCNAQTYDFQPAAATGIPAAGLFISPSAFAVVDEESGLGGERGSFDSVADGRTPLVCSGAWGFGGRMCGRHF